MKLGPGVGVAVLHSDSGPSRSDFAAAVAIAVCSATYLLVERPMQGVGRKLAKRLDARFGPDRFQVRMRAPEPVLATSSRAAD